ncbi:chromosome segregation protein SMC [Ferrimonas lipolytica]|uniref:Chromosome partition protein Smc n=1 Tax=Ferrimonas lipolytica TaxID=2724191 RepID=A0A6H1UCS6_9GAMM|nr:chromosome segregation protein SMC [Ferrimonas lipolytica]QIZ76871.1 chromosome segregation protein SMC [Ferrimonas lipolytica]
MRLKHIKLAGFKSFVDPTKVAFPDSMTAIVGPNGCGKSNVIDAVRWVLGESNAKNLRGDAMTDVIFNGSTGRKPVSVASVELVFDNSEGRLEGQFGSYAELSVKRQVNREAQSSYFLNGSKCRRRDITDLFMGTGLGPRSYAIIEQGTVSRLIESKPQELRVFIEEAAGISRYKERRRETESRIRHTRENLERLADIRNELGSQISKLQQQAEAAQQYRLLKGQERTLQGEIIALRWRDADSKMKQLAEQIKQLSYRLNQLDGSLAGDDAQLALLQQQKSDVMAAEKHSQQRRFEVSDEITKIEQQLLHLKERQQQLTQEQRRTQQQLADAQSQQLDLQSAQQTLEQAVQQASPMLTLLHDTAAAIKSQYQTLEQQHERLEQQREGARADKASAEREVHDVHSALQVNQREQQQQQQQQTRLEQQLQQLTLPQLQASKQQAQKTVAQAEQDHAEQKNKLQASQERQQRLQAEQQQLLEAQQQLQHQQTQVAAQFNANETLLAARQGELPPAFAKMTKAWQQLQIDADWALAVESVLGPRLQAVVGASSDLPAGVWQLQLSPTASVSPRTWPTLASKLESGFNLEPWLGWVYCAEDDNQAQQWLVDCLPHESVILADGRWFGVGFQANAGSVKQITLTELVAQQRSLEQQCLQLSQTIAANEQKITRSNERVATATQQLQQHQLQLQQGREWQLAQHHELEKWQHQLTLAEQQQQLLLEQQQSNLAQRQQLTEQQQQLTTRLEQAQQRLQSVESELTQHDNNLVQHRLDLRNQREQLEQVGTKVQQSQLQQQSDKARLAGIADQLSQAHHSVQQWQQRLHDGDQQQLELQSPIEPQQLKLAELRQQRSELELSLKNQQQQLADFEGQLQAMVDNSRGQQGLRQKLMEQRSKHELEHEGLRVKAQGQLDQLAETQNNLAVLLEGLDASASLPQRIKLIDLVKQQVAQLGAINLAAIEEFDQQNQRKLYLDQQNSDLTKAIEMLEGAIRKIDRETKARFKVTFDAINADLSVLFPKVFGGGSAALALTGDDLLEAGVTIMAQPPGKKNSTIHLLSGGEKALTALSLVFAIFRLNPAPFCLLDEVDAPLDDANVSRFCRLVKEMSETVQFIFISHNKVSMEMADRLTGVTMHEPGCSRIVAVDIEEAAAMASVK